MNYERGNKYLLGQKIGNGSSADVFVGTNVRCNQQVAMKLENINATHPQLLYESKLYRILHGGPGIANMQWYGLQGQFRVLVMDLLGPTLEDLKEFCSVKFSCCKENLARFSLKTVLMLANQLINVLQYIHSKGFLHRDVKPENLLMGLGRQANQVHIIDFGLAKKWSDPKTKEHIPCRSEKDLVGTARYASIGNHLGLEQSRKDDLESLGYVFVYLLKGSLPWENIKAETREEKHERIMKMKIAMCAEMICEGLPSQFGKFLQVTRALPFQAEPDYEGYKKMFQDCLVEEGYARDYVFDWSVKHYARAGVPQKFIPLCSKRCYESTSPPLVTIEPLKLERPFTQRPPPPRPPPSRVQIPQGKLTEFSQNEFVNNHNIYLE
ncbi:uncharacterized protein [Physcomitrium patens]|uniref:uncharacterized protein isoform X2 n=1 Tax=Physcomitrium patens TaxID=3218 RepID=UPI000D170261|nr:casein kinase I-like isoform X2 [Physcomitrium patens]|eukprot:XP_024382400.1 casein kinase I-like isoform X2 [Physcomitrella patens]